MKLWLISQDEKVRTDTYDSAIVCAATEDDARRMHPWDGEQHFPSPTWASAPEQVSVKLLGAAEPRSKQGVVLSSFNGGFSGLID